MKFNSLVVAAMVIASVNAGGRKKSAGGHRHNDGSGPSSEAVISRVYVPVPVVPSESASSRDFSEEEWAVLEGRDPISVQKVRDLKDYGTIKTPDCDTLFGKLQDLQGRILQLSDKYSSCRLTLCKININADRFKPEEMDEYLKSHATASGTMQRARQVAITLKEEYERTWMSFEDAGCLNQSNRLFTPKEIDKWVIFLGNPVKLPVCERDRGIAV
ncbi:hypothetical protein BASA81_005236 [Batrachochytrium salamandrivorans]|nr:hypothetical protein BASA81_005236 [Batrachochytrium salamandrivorans]